MKIGILTFHYARNYGAVLQAYALKKVLNLMGHAVETINYQNVTIVNRKKPFQLSFFIHSPILFILQFINTYWGYSRKRKSFSKFENKYLEISTSKYDCMNMRNADYDCIIIGSDQVWSPVITGGPDEVYWGIHKPLKAKLITYAASSCDTKLMEGSDFSDVGKWLNNFDAISVREGRLKTYVEAKSSKIATVVCDPTLLAGRKIFDELCSKKIINEKYVFLYSVEQNSKTLSIAREIAKQYNAKLVMLYEPAISSAIKHFKDGIIRINASVEQMLSLIKYSECVVVLSFHGTALSMLFEKDFYSIQGMNMARIEEILRPCHLMNRIITDVNDFTVSHIDYTNVSDKLELIRKESYQWLNNQVS